MNSMIIAIDGPAASGKGTIGRRLAQHYGYRYLDTGLLYRAVGRAVKNRGLSFGDENAVTEVARKIDLTDVMASAAELAHYGEEAAKIAAIPNVRSALLSIQRDFSNNEPGAVLDGRDIGTVVCPEADVKFFITASPEVRAR